MTRNLQMCWFMIILCHAFQMQGWIQLSSCPKPFILRNGPTFKFNVHNEFMDFSITDKFGQILHSKSQGQQ